MLWEHRSDSVNTLIYLGFIRSAERQGNNRVTDTLYFRSA